MRFLIYGGTGIGDIIITLPMAAALKEKYKDCKVDYLTASNNKRIEISKEIMKYQNYFNDVMYYNIKDIFNNVKLIKNMRSKKYKLGFICQYHNIKSSVWPSIIFKLGGCESVGMQPINPKIHYNHVIQDKPKIHMSDRFFFLLNYIDINSKPDIDCFFDSDKIKGSIVDKLKTSNADKKIIGICIGAGKITFNVNNKKLESDNKSWGVENWIKLSSQLIKNNFAVVLLGGNEERKLIDELKTKFSSQAIDLVNRTSIGESLAVLQQTDIVVGADTGMMHCAAALGKKTISLFGCTDYKEYQPYGSLSESIYTGIQCSPCFGTEESVLCTHKRCMKEISVDIVCKKILERI